MSDSPMNASGETANDEIKSKGKGRSLQDGRKSMRKASPVALIIDFPSGRGTKAGACASKRVKDPTEQRRIAQKRYQILKAIMDDESIDNGLIDQIHQFLARSENPD